MTSPHQNDAGPNRPGDLGDADRILLMALRAWGGRSGEQSVDAAAPDGPGTLRSRLWNRLEPSWGHRLRDAWDHGLGSDPAAAREVLERAHRAVAHVDPARVHPSWWVRALREESPTVRRVVVAAAPEPVRNPVQTGLLLDNDDLRTDRTPDPDVLAWVMSLWSERLVGGGPVRSDDPPAIVALSGLSPRAGYCLCHCAGIAKLALAGRAALDHDTTPAGRARGEWLRDRLAFAGPEFAAVARHDVKAFQGTKLPRLRRTARLGLLTLARLLTDCEPFRVRWALQHWPYTIAKLTRSLMTQDAKRSPVVARVESQVLKTAWDRLNLEERLRMTWPGSD
jgi:hypothetical protein